MQNEDHNWILYCLNWWSRTAARGCPRHGGTEINIHAFLVAVRHEAHSSLALRRGLVTRQPGKSGNPRIIDLPPPQKNFSTFCFFFRRSILMGAYFFPWPPWPWTPCGMAYGSKTYSSCRTILIHWRVRVVYCYPWDDSRISKTAKREGSVYYALPRTANSSSIKEVYAYTGAYRSVPGSSIHTEIRKTTH
jgi:hypothetical protein